MNIPTAIVNRTPTPAADPAMAMFRDERRLESFEDVAPEDGDVSEAFWLLRRSYDTIMPGTALLEENTTAGVELSTTSTVRVAMAVVGRLTSSG
jgi:hypothetical protein